MGAKKHTNYSPSCYYQLAAPTIFGKTMICCTQIGEREGERGSERWLCTRSKHYMRWRGTSLQSLSFPLSSVDSLWLGSFSVAFLEGEAGSKKEPQMLPQNDCSWEWCTHTQLVLCVVSFHVDTLTLTLTQCFLGGVLHPRFLFFSIRNFAERFSILWFVCFGRIRCRRTHHGMRHQLHQNWNNSINTDSISEYSL